MDVKFYKDTETGGVILSLKEIEDDKYKLLKANDTDAAVEKHVPVVTVNDKNVHVVVGSVIHPMTEVHYIASITLVTDRKAVMKKLDFNGTPEADFPLEEGEKVLAAYEYCNLHGLWVKNID